MSSRDIPAWLTPMEVVAWIISQDAEVVSYASLDRNRVRTHCIADKLPPQVSANMMRKGRLRTPKDLGKSWPWWRGHRYPALGGNPRVLDLDQALPTGMSLEWLNAYAVRNGTKLDAEEAKGQLVAALRAGDVRACGEWVRTGERRHMIPEDWAGLTLDIPPKQHWRLLPYRVANRPCDNGAERMWRDVRLCRDHVFKLWPPTPTEQNVVAVSDVPTSAEHPSRGRIIASDVHRSVGAPKVMENASDTQPLIYAGNNRQMQRPVPQAGLERWYVERRDSWPDGTKHPSEDQDWIDAKAQFPDHQVTREAVRTVRRNFAPAVWTAHGRRKNSRGKENTASLRV